MIDPVKHHGRELARCTCDECQAVLEFPAMHGAANGGGRKIEPVLQNKGSVTKAYQAKGWAMIGRKLICPECQQKRKTPMWYDVRAAMKELEMQKTSNVEPIRQATRDQKFQITEMLMATYDKAAGRYTGKETDMTIADAIGGGCMFGWVAAIREDMFGPDGGNEEQGALAADLKQTRADLYEMASSIAAAIAKVDAAEKRLCAVIKATGPKAQRA
jgi:hypothetical protein